MSDLKKKNILVQILQRRLNPEKKIASNKINQYAIM